MSIVLMTTASTPAAGQQGAGDPVADGTYDDRDIQYAVERELRTDPTGPFPRVDVVSREGVVTLEGAVGHLHARRRAVTIAGEVRGVRAVVDSLTVETGTRSDRLIVRDVRAALRDSAEGVRDLDVTVADGNVVLRGTVPSWGEKRLATMLATRIRGVTGVESEVTIDQVESPDDATLERAVEEALAWDRLLDGASVAVSVDDGLVTLSGSVRSVSQREHAETVAWLVGARAVEWDDIVLESAPSRTDATRVRPADDEIRRALEAAVRRDARVRPVEFEPTVTDGMATLRGIVETPQEARRIEQDARNTVGVRGVRNQLKVRPSGRGDDLERERAVREALRRNPYVYRFDVDIDVEGDEAILRGTVETVFERAQATAVASDVQGIVHVDNRLEVRAPNRAYFRHQELEELYALEGEFDERPRAPGSVRRSDEAIRDAIEDELWWSPFVDGDRITVDVDAGVATLTGRVDSLREREVASENAFEGGAVHVINRLDVSSEEVRDDQS